MKYFLIMLAIVSVAGCAATSTPVKSKRGVHINCSGLSSSWDKCYEMATDSCESKQYRVIAKSGEASEDPTEFPLGLNPAGYTSRSMIIVCKKPGRP
ncbi:hypothetical protein [Pseudomonas sp. LP_7_YM]|uniref:hypothetical protein n=1 Tax=Pseudomonas sp. LP_7_YM TaxID=2485137 RepID=UPI00105C87C6|nr:hypothetical protein [Pseudomonas sp. LP_7_YM]TDV63495.1 hypothetical protein EC915_106262 [Pseudomonas sp. LP_7_YM]